MADGGGEQTRPAVSDRLTDALNVVRHALVQAKRTGRDDFVHRLQREEQRLNRPTSRIAVIGEFKKGKSSLVNALLGGRVCPTDPVDSTTVPTLVRHGSDVGGSALVAVDSDGDEAGRSLDAAPEVVTREMGLDVLADWAGGVTAPRADERLVSVELTAPLPLLERGLVVVDTPPVGGGMASTAAASVLKGLTGVDAAVFVTDASQELTAPEVEVLRHAADLAVRVLVVMAKVDFYPDWRLITKLDTAHLERLGIDAEFVPVSSPMWHAALMSEDRELARGSGIPDLTNWVSAVVLGDTERRVVEQSAAAVVAVVDQVHGTALAEREALSDPRNARAMMSDLELARARAEAMRGDAARWQQRLNDGITDVLSDVEHDLSRRFHAIDAEAEQVLGGGDPVNLWAEFEPWLYRRTNEDILANHQHLLDSADGISDEISELFFIEEQEVLDEMRTATPDQRLAEVRLSDDVNLEKMSRQEVGFTALRGSAGSVVIAGMVGGFAAILAPIAVPIAALSAPVLAVVLGRRSVKGAKEADLEKRRREARAAYRKYLEQARFGAQKECRDTVRRVHRTIRDHYAVRADEIGRTASEDLQAVARGMQDDRESLKDRVAELDRLIRQLRLIKAHALRLSPHAAQGASDGD